MIVRDLRYGSKAIARIYRNGVIIWEGGKKFTLAQLISVLTGVALVDTDYPVPIQMDADINAETTGKPFPADANASAYGKAELFGNVVPQPADTVNGRAETKSVLTAIAMPLSALYIWCRGKLAMAFGTKGMAQPADTINGAGETTASLTEQATPNAQGMTAMLFQTEGKLGAVATHENAETLEKASSYASGKLNMEAQPNVKTVCDVTFVVNGKVEHQTVVLEGEAPSDPVADGTIEDTTKESTAQYHFHYAGWSKTEDGEPLEDLTVTEDTVFYAVYDKELRYYTINFYNDDGTLFESKPWAYGDTPSITIPEKDGYAFGGWSPTLAPVTGDADYVATWVEETYIMTGTLGSIVWTLSERGKLAFSGTGTMGGLGGAYNQPWVDYRDQIVSVKIGDGITSIGKQTLSQLKNVEELIIPEGVTTIGDYAIVNSKFKRIYLPSTLTTIGTWAFSGVDAIEELHIADLTAYLNIKTGAAWGNVLAAMEPYKQKTVNLYIADELVSGLEIPSSITKIPAWAFHSCNLSYVKIHSNVNQISRNAFYGSTLENASFDATAGWWWATSATATSGTEIPSADLANTTTAATYLTTTYGYRYWFKT